MRSVWVGAPALLTALLVATVGVLALVVGVAGVVPASAATATYTYDTAAYAYDGPARLSSPETVATDARGSPSGLGAVSWARSVVVPSQVVAANSVPASTVRFSQSSVNGAAEIEASMRANGWVGDAIDVVRMPDGGLTSLDNTRLLAANRAGIDVQASIRGFDEALPSSLVGRFTTAKGGVPSTWGDAVMNRIGNQSAGYGTANPFGSGVTGWSGN